jgi:hypothetical protein
MCSVASRREEDSRSAGSGNSHLLAALLGCVDAIGEGVRLAVCLFKISCMVVHAMCIKKKKREFMMKEMLKSIGISKS